MDGFVRGDSKAFERLYRLLSPRVAATLAHLSGDSRLAEDLTQVVFLKVYRAHRAYQSGMPVSPWVFAIARNVLLDHRRSTRRKPECLSPNGVLPDVVGQASEDRLGVLGQLALREIIETLPESQRQALLLLKVHELSVAEAAALCGTSEGSIKMRAQRAYRTLRDALSQRMKS